MTKCIMCDYDPAAKILARWEFSIERATKSMNQHLVNRGGARFDYKAERKAWVQWVGVSKVNHQITPATGRRRLILTHTYLHEQHRRDRDNLSGGMKPVVDAFVAHGLLKDDSERWAEVHYRQQVGPQLGLLCLLEEFT